MEPGPTHHSRAPSSAAQLRANLEEEIKALEGMRQRWRALTEG